MEREKRQPVYFFGREFRICAEYEETLKEYYPGYPDFEVLKEYTDEGRPFATSAQESCQNGELGNLDDSDPGCCGECIFFTKRSTMTL